MWASSCSPSAASTPSPWTTSRPRGTSPRTFFRYFATKDEVVLDYERRLHDRLLAAFDEQPESVGAVTALRAAYVVTSRINPVDRPRVVRLGRILDTAPALSARAHGERIVPDDALVEHVARRLGVGPDDVGARTLVAAMGAVAATEYRAWVRGGGHGDPSERIAAALALLEHGLGALEIGRPGGPRRNP